MSKWIRLFCFLCLTAMVPLAAACGEDNATSVNNESSEANNNNGDNDAGDDDTGDDDTGDNNGNNNTSCASGEQLCGEDCVDTSSSDDHCGACDSPCVAPPNATASCSSGGCEFSCTEGYTDSDGDLDDPNGNGCDLECTETNGGVEICDGLDNDCDGDTDEDFADLGDDCQVGEGICQNTGELVCNADGSGVECSAEAGTPDAETCGDGLDNDCDGEVDEEDAIDASTYYQDSDGDGYGNDGISQTDCEQPDGFVEQDGDCDDADPDRNPDADEICDGVDNNCDGQKDETFTDKGSSCTVGQGVCENSGTIICSDDGLSTECNAAPGTPQESDEVTCDDLDNDCDGQADEGCDDDADGWCDENMTISGSPTVCSAGTNTFDCNDSDDTVYPGAPGLCDGKDNDCSGDVDDIKPIGSPQTTTLANTSGSSVPPGTMAVPADDDSFCVATMSGSILELSHVDAQGNHDKHAHNFSSCATCVQPTRRIADVDWNGTSCAALVTEEYWIFDPNTYDLKLTRWKPGTSTVEVIDADPDNNYTAEGNADGLNAALYHAVPQNCSILCLGAWYVGYSRNHPTSSGNYQIVYRSTGYGFTSSSGINSETVIDDYVSQNLDIELGPSPNSGDLFAAMWYDTAGTDSWEIKTKADGGSLSNAQSGLTITDANGDREHPQLAEVDGNVFLTMRDSSTNEIDVREVRSNYNYGSTTTINSSTNQDYVGRHLMAPNISQQTWSTSTQVGSYTHTPMAWYMQPYNDQLYQVSSTSHTLGGSGIGSRQAGNSNKSAGDQYLSIRKTGDYIQVLRAISGTDDVAIDELTCH